MKTLSIIVEDEFFNKIKRHIPQGKISKFISTAIKDKIDEQENALYKSYENAENEITRQKELKEWGNVNSNEWQ